MANAVREVSVGKGYDPRDFLFLAYGGTLPLFASQIAERLGISTIVIPRNSSVFCALGLLVLRLRPAQRPGRRLGPLASPRASTGSTRSPTGWSPTAIAAKCESEGFAEDQIEVQRSGDLRFHGQAYELTLPMPARALTEDDAQALFDEFLALYERTYGEGTAWKGVPASLINYSVTVDRPPGPPDARHERRRNRRRAGRPRPRDARRSSCPTERAARDVPIYRRRAFTAGATVEGPADHRRRRHDDLRPAGNHGGARRVHELRPDALEESRDMSTPDYDVIAAEVHRKALREPHQRDGHHAGPHLRLADRHGVQGLLHLPDGHRRPSTSASRPTSSSTSAPRCSARR